MERSAATCPATGITGTTSSRRWVRRLLLSQVERSTGSDGKSSAAGAKAPHPAHPPLPSDPALNKEARYVFRELLAARHLIRHPPKPTERPKIKVPAGANGRPIAAPPLRSSAARVPVDHSSQGGGAGVTTAIALLAGCLMLAATAAFLVPVLRRRGRRREAEEAAESTNEDG